MQAQNWYMNMNASMHNNQSYQAYRESELIIDISVNNGSFTRICQEIGRHLITNSGDTLKINVDRQEFNQNQRVTKFNVFSKLERNNKGDPPNGWKENITLQSMSEKIKYKHIRYPYSQVFYTWRGFLDVYIYPKNVSITYKSGVSLVLPSTDPIEIEATAGYDREVYKWVYSNDNGANWYSINNTSLQGSQLLKISGKDVYGSDFVNKMDSRPNTWIALEYDVYESRTRPRVTKRTNIISLTNIKSAPYISKLETINNKCFGDTDGKIKVTLSRAISSGEELDIYYGGLQPIRLTSLDADNAFYINDLQEGTYTIQVSGTTKDPTGSSRRFAMYSDGVNHKKEATITSPPELSYSVKDNTNILCKGNDEGSFVIKAEGGSGGYRLHYRRKGAPAYNELSFGEGRTEITVNNLYAGEYEYYVTDKNGCYKRNNSGNIDVLEVELTQPAEGMSFELYEAEQPSGFGESNGSLTIEGEGGSPDPGGYYTVTWLDPDDQVITGDIYNETFYGKFRSTVNNIKAGRYTAIIQDNNNCMLRIYLTLDQPELLVASVSRTKSILCNGDSNGELTASATGGVLEEGWNYSYEWYIYKDGSYSFFDSGKTIGNLEAGQYKVEVTDMNDNLAVTEFTLTQPTVLKGTFTTSDVTCFGHNNGTITVSLEGGSGSNKLFYKLKNDNNYSMVNINTNPYSLNALVSGEYEFYITDVNGCYALINDDYSAEATISQPDEPLTISFIRPRTPSGFGRSDGHITIHVEGGTPNTTGAAYNIIWKDSLNQVIPSVDSLNTEGTYVSVINNLARGNYSVEIKDKNYAGIANACYLSETFTLTEPEPIIIQVENTLMVQCYGDSSGILTASVKGGVPYEQTALPYTYTWYKQVDGNEVLIAGQNDSIIYKLPIGKYKVKIADSSFPPNTEESGWMEITQPDSLEISYTTQGVSCFGMNDGFIRVKAAGGVGGYQLFCKNLERDSAYIEYAMNVTDSTFYIENLYGGNYSFYVMDAHSCYAKIDGDEIHEVFLNQPNGPLRFTSALSYPVSGAGAKNGRLVVGIAGGTPEDDNTYTVVWKREADQAIMDAVTSFENGVFTSTLKNLEALEYTIEVYDKNYDIHADKTMACFLSRTFTITEPEELVVIPEETHVVTCHGMNDGELVIHATGGVQNLAPDSLPYKYTWFKETGGKYWEINGQTDSILTNLTSGKYRVKVEDYSWITNWIEIDYELVEPAPLEATATEAFVTCGEIVDVTVDVTGGTPPYRYEWNTGDTTQMLLNAGPGQYIVFVTDSRGCTTTAMSKITTAGGLSFNVKLNDPLCYLGSNGSIELNVTGGMPPYTYQWSTGATTQHLSGVPAGNYHVTVRDSENCSLFESYTLSDPEAITVDVGEDRTLCIGQKHLLAPVVEDPLTRFSWTGPDGFTSTEPQIWVEKAGIYSLTITDSNGCQATDEMEITGRNVNIDSEIAIASNVFAGDSIVVVNINNFDYDRVEWLIKESDSLVILEQNEHSANIRFNKTGYYTIGMRTYVGDCYQEVTKSVTVTDPDNNGYNPFGESIVNKFVVYPNPNDGRFSVEVGMNKISSIRLRIVSVGSGLTVSDTRYSGQKDYIIPYDLFMVGGVYAILLETPSGYMNIKMVVK